MASGLLSKDRGLTLNQEHNHCSSLRLAPKLIGNPSNRVSNPSRGVARAVKRGILFRRLSLAFILNVRGRFGKLNILDRLQQICSIRVIARHFWLSGKCVNRDVIFLYTRTFRAHRIVSGFEFVVESSNPARFSFFSSLLTFAGML